MITISLTKGFATIIDDCDADLVEFNWTTQGGLPHPYAKRTKGPRTYYMHREIAARSGQDVEGRYVDHINGDTLDNRRGNLRAVSQVNNGRNRAGPNKQNRHGHLGVGFYAGRWKAYITEQRPGGGRKQHNLGWFETKEEAVAARLKAESELWGTEPRRAEAHGSAATC